MRRLWIVISLMIFCIVIFVVIGLLLPRQQSFTRDVEINQPVPAIWRAVSDCPAEPSWRPDLKSCDRLPDENGHATYRLTTRRGRAMKMEVVESIPPQHIMFRFLGLPSNGTIVWIFNLDPWNGGTKISLTQNDSVGNPLARILYRTVFRTEFADGYLDALARKFGNAPSEQ